MIERAIFEVLIDGKWVQWGQLSLHKGQTWDGNCLNDLRPETRIRFERPSEDGQSWEERK